MGRTIIFSTLVLLMISCFTACTNGQQFSLPGRPLTRHPGLQVDGEGRVFVTAGDQLFKLNSDLVPELNVTLSSVAVNISLSSGGEWLVVCTRNLSCAVYNTSDFTLQTRYTSQDISQGILGNSERVALFTAGDSFYVGSVFTPPEGQSGQLGGGIYLRQFSAANSSFVRTRDYDIRTGNFERTFYGGFTSGPYSYFIVTDHSPTTSRSIRMMRVCDVTGCPEGRSMCSFTALYEEDLRCGTTLGIAKIDGICGISVVEDFADSAGITLLVTRCREESINRNLVCAINLEDIDRTMERRFNECMAGNGDIDLAWGIEGVICQGNEGNFQPMRMCDLGNIAALDDKDIQDTSGVDVLPQVISREIIDIGRDVLNRGSPDPTITASVALKVDNYSLMAVAYTDTRNIQDFRVEIFLISNLMTAQTVSNGFGGQFVSSPVRSLQWQRGLDYVVAATNSEVLKIPVEECGSILNCSSCVINSNPLCGWCVVENKCSRQSQCQDGNSTSSMRWIASNPSADVTAQCIVSTVSPDQFILKSEQLLNVSVDGPGLPAKFINESYLCHFEDSFSRFNITVPAEEIIEGTNYTCNITSLVPPYDGVQAVMHFSFVSSLVGVPFDRTDNALTIYRCNATSSCSECLNTDNACGWCVINKLCRGTAEDCTNITNFLQVSDGDTFEDVCPLLDLKDGITNYTQHVRITSKLQLTTRNLPDNVTGFSYTCRINGMNFNAVRNNETYLTCMVDANQLSIPSGSGSEITDISIIWRGPDVEHTIDTLMETSVVLYDCMSLARDCSSCVGSRITSDFQCGWCNESRICSINEECISPPPPPLLTMGGQCPHPIITDFSPSSGPPNGGTLIEITGRDLGVSFAEFLEDDFDTIAIGGNNGTRRVACIPVNMEDHISGKRIFCRTGPDMAPGAQRLFISLRRDSGIVNVYATQQFMVVLPTLNSVDPSFGPIAGGSTLTVRGTGLSIGNSAMIRLDGAAGAECSNISRTDTVISCITTNTTSPSTGMLSIHIDNQTISKPGVQFEYLSNPNFTSIQPTFTIPIGGITVYFIGSNLNVSQNPQLIFNGDAYPCTVVNGTALSCIAPNITGNPTLVMYELRLDNVPPPDPTAPGLQLSVRPNPYNFTLVTDSVRGSEGAFIRIEGENLNSVERSEITVRVGGQPCVINSVDEAIICQAPMNPELDSDDRAIVEVSIGQNLNFILPQTLLYTSSSDSSIPLMVIIPAVVGPVVLILILCSLCIICICCMAYRSGKKKEQQYTSLIAKMELLEYEMADECKRAFTELQTDLADLVQISSDKNLPYRDFRTFAMRFLFPKAGDDHPVLLPLKLEGKKEKEDVMKQLDQFQDLVMNKKFLLVFIHTLESQPNFSLQDKVTVASLLMVAFQNDLDYATDVLQTLLAELMRKTIAKSHPKLLLRRTESVAEKMLANWLAFLLFPYILEHVGEPLFVLFRAIKSQLEKGPVDIISGEAKNSLSEEKLLRQHMEVKPVEGVLLHEDEEIPIKMWDCDSITQAKEKILDTLYRNTPISKRPKLTDIDLELVSKGNNGIILRDQDATNAQDGEWIKLNTLGHYKLDEMSSNHVNNPKLPIPKFKLVDRPSRPLSGVSSGFDTLGTIISNISAANRSSMLIPNSELNRVYHLVKPEPENGDVSGATKIMSEVFLTRLLSTKRILQSYVDKLFEAIFSVPHGKVLPKAIKSLFDFLDLQASELGVSDSDVLHSWKTNSVPLRFWVNVIKNPDFVFDINKSATVDSCLTVIAQAYIDATSTADIKYTKDTPSARLLYVNEVKKYKAGVESYYSTIQSLPKLSNGDMAEYLRDTAQVNANSVPQYNPDVADEVTDPASMTRQLYFVTESALYELFKYASEYSEEIIDALNEEGLTIPAAGFDQIIKALRE